MTISDFKRVCLFCLIGFLSLSALVAVVSFLGGDFGETQVKVILTTLAISGASIGAMACSAFIEKRGAAPLGGLGIGFAAAAAGMAISGMWMEAGGAGYWKTTATLGVLAAAFAHGLLLWMPTLAHKYRWSQAAVTLSVAVLAAQILLAVWNEPSGTGFYRAMGVVAVLVVLFTLIVPICAKLSGGGEAEDGKLVLTRVDGEVYRDASGVRYRVSRV